MNNPSKITSERGEVMKTLKSLILSALFSAMLTLPVVSQAGSYSNYAAYYFNISQNNRALATNYALSNGGSSAYDYYVYIYLNGAYSNASTGYAYANYQYAYENGSTNCYYAQYYAYYAQTYAYYAQYYAYYKYYGYNYRSNIIDNNYNADLNASLANYYLFFCS
jgi:hypothetical protein